MGRLSKSFSNHSRLIKYSLPKKAIFLAFSILFWIFIWNVYASKLNNNLFLPSPREVVNAFFALIKEDNFKLSVTTSLLNITKGFLMSVTLGIILAIISALHDFLKMIISIPMKIIKATPVASFTILALLWIDSKDLSILVSFLMGLPIMYTNTLKGIEETDHKLLEMSKIFSFRTFRTIRYVYCPSIAPFFISACSVTAGMAWKSGIAAEVIGIAKNSIGNELYQSKLYLEIPRLFAFTFVIIVISILFEKISLLLFGFIVNLLTHKKYIKPLSNIFYKLIHPLYLLKYKKMGMAPTITLDKINKRYDDKLVLDDLNLSFEAGKCTAIMAPSGQGKTTLINIIAGLTKADSGVLSFSNKPFFSVVFQEDRLIDNTDIATNIIYRSPNLHDSSESLGASESLEVELNRIGISDSIYTKISSLSGGMKRRISLLRALTTPSNVLILDEPFKGLDDELKLAVMEYVKEKSHDKTVLLITHDIEEANFFTDRIINL